MHNLLIHEPYDNIVYPEIDPLDQEDCDFDFDPGQVNAHGNLITDGVLKRNALVLFVNLSI
jgi:hypothetical protein